MSAIKRFFSSHKTSSHSKNNSTSNHDTQTSQSKPVVTDKVTVLVDHDESKENTSPIAELPSKYVNEGNDLFIDDSTFQSEYNITFVRNDHISE